MKIKLFIFIVFIFLSFPSSSYAEELFSIKINIISRHGSSYKEPGETRIKISSSPEALYMYAVEPKERTDLRWVTNLWYEEELKKQEQIHKDHFEEITEYYSYLEKQIKIPSGYKYYETNEIYQPWECTKPKQTFIYTFKVSNNIENFIEKKITFHSHLTKRWCIAAKQKAAREKAAQKRRYEEEIKRTEENERRSAEAERHRFEKERYYHEENCRKIGGTIVYLYVGSNGAQAPYCKLPNGNVIEIE